MILIMNLVILTVYSYWTDSVILGLNFVTWISAVRDSNKKRISIWIIKYAGYAPTGGIGEKLNKLCVLGTQLPTLNMINVVIVLFFSFFIHSMVMAQARIQA